MQRQMHFMFKTLVKRVLKTVKHELTKSPVKLTHEIPLSASCSNGVQPIQGLGKVREDWTAA